MQVSESKDDLLQEIELSNFNTNEEIRFLKEKIKTIKPDTILQKIISITLHILLIFSFEAIFFFVYVTKIEEEMLYDKFETQINKLSKICLDYHNQIIIDIEYGFNDLITNNNVTLIDSYHDAIKNRKGDNEELYDLACSYIIYACISFGLLVLLSILLRKKWKVKWIPVLSENIITIFLLGIIEYIFFINIVLPYNPLSATELNYLLLNGLKEGCELDDLDL